MEQNKISDFIKQATYSRKNSRWVLVFSLALAGFLHYLALIGIDWAEFFRVIRGAQYGYLIATVVLSSANYLLRSQHWRLKILAAQPTALLTVFWANMIGYLGNSYLPARAGEVLHSIILGKNGKYKL
jgi:uncharacterized membrane protein YbhN (UPF0104 family)